MACLTMTSDDIVAQLYQLADEKQAEKSRRFFKTAPGQYSAGDQFIGIRMPTLRQVVKQVGRLPLSTELELLARPEHEIRLFALLSMVAHYAKSKTDERQQVAQAYLANTHWINNWDLVDCSAYYLLGRYCDQFGKLSVLNTLAQSANLWEKRIAIVSTYHFIRQNQFQPTCQIAALLLTDPNDLIHKATGWMIKEVSKRDITTAQRFLNHYGQQMHATAMRCATEKFPPEQQLQLRQLTK